MTTRVARTASWGTLPAPNDMPSRVMSLAVVRWPATEKAASVESVPAIPTTPGASVAMVFKSEASIGNRASSCADRSRSSEPGVGRSLLRGVRRAVTVTGSSGTAASPMWKSATSRSSSAWRAMVRRTGAMPM